MPRWAVDIFANDIARLDAEEALHLTTIVQCGTGSLKKGKINQIQRRWQRLANKRKRRAKFGSIKEVAALAGIGFEMVTQDGR